MIATCETIDLDPGGRRTLAALARQVGLTAPALQRAFVRYAGTTPHHYLVTRRLQRAARHLDEGASVSDASFDSGFENLSHFCRTFLRIMQCRPSQWRQHSAREKREIVQAILRRVG